MRLRPRAGGDVFDLALAGRTAVVEGIEQDLEGNLQLAVAIDDDPGRDLGDARQPGHRFFFSPDEVEPLGARPPRRAPRILVAGIGNVFLGDDGFGVALAGRLAAARAAGGRRGRRLRHPRDGPRLRARRRLRRGAARSTPRRAASAPGTLSVIEPELADLPLVRRRARMDPVKVLGLARALGGALPRVSSSAASRRT